MRILVQQDPTIKPVVKKYEDTLQNILTLKKKIKPYDKSNIADFKQIIKNQRLFSNERIQQSQQQSQLINSKTMQKTYSKISLTDQRMNTEEADTKFDIYDSYFRYKEPVSEQPESKISRKNYERGHQMKKNTIIKVDDMYQNRLLSQSRSQQSFLPLITPQKSSVLTIGYETPMDYRKVKGFQTQMDLDSKKTKLQQKLKNLGKVTKEFYAMQLRQKQQRTNQQSSQTTGGRNSRENSAQKSQERIEDMTGGVMTTASMGGIKQSSMTMTNVMITREEKLKLLQKKKEEDEARQLNYLFDKYSTENMQKTFKLMQQIPFEDISKQIEQDIYITQQLLFSFSENTYISSQLETINVDLGSFIRKAKKDKELKDKIRNEEAREQNLFEKARTFNVQTVNTQIDSHFQRQTESAVDELKQMNVNIKGLLDNYSNLKVYYEEFRQELKKPLQKQKQRSQMLKL